jgi:hypothetical protein
MLGSVAGYFFSVIAVFATVMTFMMLLIGVFDNSAFEKLRHYPRPIIERTVPPTNPDASTNPEPRRARVALGTNDATAPKHLSAPDKNTKDTRAASGAKADAENRKPERNIRPERLAHLGQSKALAHQRQNYEGHGYAVSLGNTVAAALGGLVGGLADSVLTALSPQLRPDAGADNQSAAPAPQSTPPVRIIGGAKPGPSADTPGPAPAPQQRPQPGSTPLPQSILAAKPLGPASQFQPPGTTPAQAASGIAQQLGARAQSNQARSNQAPGNQQQVATPAQQQTAPQVSATPAPYAAIANDDDRPAASRRVRHPRKQATFTSNAPRYRDENYVPRYGPDQYGAWSGGATQRFDARGYDRLYNSYGEPQFGPDARYLRRSRVNPRSPETLYSMQTGPPRREQYWVGGLFGGYRYGD